MGFTDRSGLMTDPLIIDAIILAQILIDASPECRALFGGKNPEEILSRLGRKIYLEEFRTDSDGNPVYSTDQDLEANTSVGGFYNSKADAIVLNRLGTFGTLKWGATDIRTGRKFLDNYSAFSMWDSVSPAQLRAVFLIHELIHAAGGFPGHSVNGSSALNVADTIKVINACVRSNQKKKEDDEHVAIGPAYHGGSGGDTDNGRSRDYVIHLGR